ncbi:hypothetical protein [Desulfocurvus sp. DL9XJH121]
MTSSAFKDFAGRVNLILLFDHVGRAGNGFFLCLFDRHPQVLTCPWVHYLYSYLDAEFGESVSYEAKQAYDFVATRSYFRYVFQDVTEEMAATMRRFGASPESPLDRRAAREFFAACVQGGPRISRRDLVAAAYGAYAVGTGRNLDEVKYILIPDAVSLRHESLRGGFSGRIADSALHDFPEARMVSLVRDPRAMFASNRHQFVNANDNMYAVTPAACLARLAELVRLDLHPENSVWLYWLWYAAATGRTIYRLKSEHGGRFLTLRNEDINLCFTDTLKRLCAWLGVDFYGPWAEEGFEPTSVGLPWRGTGAYNSRYQVATDGPLANDPQSVADTVTGPNRYVTERWRSRLPGHEVRLLDALFDQEMSDLGYGHEAGPRPRLWPLLLCPFSGELPSVRWLSRGWGLGLAEGARRLFYACVFPLFGFVSRIQLLRLVARGEFDNPWIARNESALLRPEADPEPRAG